MGLGGILRRVGAASPLVPALGYTAVTVLANLLTGWFPDSAAVVGLSLLLWLAAGVLLFIVVTWYRDDDWLAAGFLLGLTVLLSGWIANVVADVVATGSPAGAIFASAGVMLGTALRAVILVPVSGGVVALARWMTRRLRGKHPPAGDAVAGTGGRRS